MSRNDKMEPWEQVQVKTFTKWVNAKLAKGGYRDTVENLLTDLSSGIILHHLLESISNEKLPKINMNPKMDIFKIQNLNVAIDYIKRHIRVSCGAEDFIRGDKRSVLGCIWTIILRWEIQDISVEDMNAKEGLLLWCQKKTAGYKGVDVRDFTRSWHDGLAYCALIHKHRPDLIDFDSLSKNEPEKNLELAFSVAEKELNIPRFFDVEDVPVADERSVMTYLLQFFHLFSANRKAEAAGKSISKLLDDDLSNDQLRDKYEGLAKDLMDWIEKKKPEIEGMEPEKDLAAVQKALDDLKAYQTEEKPPKQADKIAAEGAYNNLQNKLRNAKRPGYTPPEGLTPADLNKAWDDLAKAEAEKEKELNDELARLKKIDDLMKRFNEKKKRLDKFNDDKTAYLDKRPEIDSLVAAKSEVKVLEGQKKGIDASKDKVADLDKLGNEIIELGSKDADKVKADMDDIDAKWKDLESKADDKEKWAKEELEKQEKIEKIRLDLADKMADLMRWYKENTDALEDPKFPDGLEEIKAFKPEVDKKTEDLKKTATEKDAEVDALWKELEALGAQDNKYSDYTMDDVNKAHGELDNALDKYNQDYEDEVKRQEDLDAKRREFAAAADDLANFIDDQKKTIGGLAIPNPIEMADEVKANWRMSEPQGEKLKNVRRINDECRAMGIRKNKYTPHTVNTLEILSNDHDLFVTDLLQYLEDEEKLKHNYAERAQRQKTWTEEQIVKMEDIEFEGTLESVKAKYNEFRSWRNTEKPPKGVEQKDVLTLFDTIGKTMEEHNRPAYEAPEGLSPEDLKLKWEELEEKEKLKWKAILDELARMQKLDKMIQHFNAAKDDQNEWDEHTKEYLNEPVAFETITKGQIALNLLEVSVKNREAMQDNVEDIRKLRDVIAEQNYYKLADVDADMKKIDDDMAEIKELEDKKRDEINKMIDQLEIRNKLGLEFAKLAKEYSAFADATVDELGTANFGANLEEVTAYEPTKDETVKRITDDNAAKRQAIDDVLGKWKELEMTSTPHTKMTEADIVRLDEQIQEALQKYQKDYADEVEKQKNMEDKRKEFAAACEAFINALAEERKQIDEFADPDPEVVIDQITKLHDDAKPLTEKVAECQRIHVECMTMEITSNPYTKETVKSVTNKLNEHKKYVAAYLAYLRDEKRDKDQYIAAATVLVDWLKEQLEEMGKNEIENDYASVRKAVNDLNKWRNSDKSQKVADKKRLFNDYAEIENEIKAAAFKRPEFDAGELSPSAIEELFSQLTEAEKQKGDNLQKELKRLEGLNRAAKDFKENADDLQKWINEKKEFLTHEEEITSLLAAKVQLGLVDTFNKDYAAQQKAMDDLTAAKDALVEQDSPNKDEIAERHGEVETEFKGLEDLSKTKEELLKELEAKEAAADEARKNFAKLAAAFDKYARITPAKIAKYHFGNSLKHVTAYKATKEAADKEITEKVDTQKAAIDECDNKLKELGVTTNDYTLLKMEDIEADKQKIMDALEARTAAYEKEVENQNTMDEKRKAYAAGAKEFVEAVQKNKADIDAVEGTAEEKIAKITELYAEGAPLKELHDNVDKLDAEQKSAGVKENKLAPVTLSEATSLFNKHEKYVKNLLKALEEERARDERKKAREAERAAKEELENKRNGFIEKSAGLNSWIENAEDELTSNDRINSLQELEEVKNSLEKIKTEKEEKNPLFTELLQEAQELEKEGADVNAEEFANSWNNIFTLIGERDAFIAEEEPKQKEIDELRHKFADVAEEFHKLLEEEQKKEVTGTIEEQLNATNADVARVSAAIAKGADELSDLNERLVEFNVRGNPYTELTLKGLKEMSESVMDSIKARRADLEDELNKKNGSKASPEEIEEFRELFRTFAKGGSELKWYEFKAVLSALGDDVNDDEAKKLFDSVDINGDGGIEFNEFMEFMIKRRESSDSPEAIIEAFREIAGGKDYITEAEMAPHLTPAQLEHAKKVMPKKGDGYDYTAYTSASFN